MATSATESLDQQVDLSTIPISPGGKEDGADAKNSDGTPVTVFHDKDNFNVKHPLQNKWTLWFTKPPSGKVRGCHSILLQANIASTNVANRATTTGTTC